MATRIPYQAPTFTSPPTQASNRAQPAAIHSAPSAHSGVPPVLLAPSRMASVHQPPLQHSGQLAGHPATAIQVMPLGESAPIHAPEQAAANQPAGHTNLPQPSMQSRHGGRVLNTG